jgi:PAS domain S-box-containing protein
LAELARQHAFLESELDSRKRIERTLSQQRQALQSSKTVLEMHVEASTLELEKLQDRYELILNSAGEGICGLDPHGKAAFVNPAVARITGWSLAELIGKTEREIFYPNGSDGHTESRDANFGEQLFYRKDGTRFPVEFVRTKIEENGRQTGSVLIFKDITERKRTEENLFQKAAELARSNAELEQFAFVASHDLQEPLRKIQSFGDRLKAKLDQALGPEPREYLDRMQNASARMRTLIDDLLAFSRVIRSAEPFVPVSLTQITKEVIGDLEVRMEKNAARVEVGDLPTIEADATQMRQLMLNLIGNALKFQPLDAQPLVKVQGRTVTSISGEQFCELTVQDNGIGFEEQYAEKIFVVFQRLHGRGEYEGTGVGLAVCRRITDRHQGTIVAKGKPGEGATFIVTLPVHQSKPKAPHE